MPREDIFLNGMVLKSVDWIHNWNVGCYLVLYREGKFDLIKNELFLDAWEHITFSREY